jgi:hypothetical protein
MAGGRVQPRTVQLRSRATSARRWAGVIAVAQGLEAGDLPQVVEQHLGDAGVAEQRFDADAGLRSGPGCGGAGLLGADAAVPGQGCGDGVGEGPRPVVVGSVGHRRCSWLLLLCGGPVGGQT